MRVVSEAQRERNRTSAKKFSTENRERLNEQRRTPEYRERRREAYRRDPAKFARPNARRYDDPIKQAARRKLRDAVKLGKIIKPEYCDSCGKKPELSHRLHGHHVDYSKPYDVEWLCSECHGQRHVKVA